ncbi:MAG: hypothetical protein LQ352_008346 [Teloschistes flavicans]|nr:MAG: hypothetical protein LQ352_008346 [Teloschistes flavicans]
MQGVSFLLVAFFALSALVAGDSQQFTSLNDLLSSTAIPPGVTNDLMVATELYYAACPTSVPEISTAACFLREPEMYSSLVSNIKSAGFWDPRIPSNYKATATDIASKWIHQLAVVAAVTSTSALDAVKTSQPTFSRAPPTISYTPTVSTTIPSMSTLQVPDVSHSTAPTLATLIPTTSGRTPATTVSQIPSPIQTISSTPKPTSSPNRFQRLSVTAQVFTILGPFIAATVAVLLFVLTLRHQRRKKARVAAQDRRHGTPDSEAAIDGPAGAANATTYNNGNGNAVAGTHNKNRPRYHRDQRNRYYGPVYVNVKPQANDDAGSIIQPPIHLRDMGSHNGSDSDV